MFSMLVWNCYVTGHLNLFERRSGDHFDYSEDRRHVDPGLIPVRRPDVTTILPHVARQLRVRNEYFEEETRKMAEEIARQERANTDSVSECSQIASDVSRDLLAYISSYRPTESINVSSLGNIVNVSTLHSTLEITCAAPQSFRLVDRDIYLPARIRTQPARPASTSGAPVDRSTMVRGVLIWLQDNGVA
jgi:hypothetical protein